MSETATRISDDVHSTKAEYLERERKARLQHMEVRKRERKRAFVCILPAWLARKADVLTDDEVAEALLWMLKKRGERKDYLEWVNER